MNIQQVINFSLKTLVISMVLIIQEIVPMTASPFDENQNICVEWECDQAGNCQRISVPCGQSTGQSTINSPPQSSTSTYSEYQLFSNNNIYGVLNSPRNTTQFYLPQATQLTYFMNYHWNSGRGQAPGTMWLTHQDGTTYGPWQATTEPGQGGVPNAYWIVRPNVILKAGNYTIGDSHPSSWAHNQQSEFRGMSVVKGRAPSH